MTCLFFLLLGVLSLAQKGMLDNCALDCPDAHMLVGLSAIMVSAGNVCVSHADHFAQH